MKKWIVKRNGYTPLMETATGTRKLQNLYYGIVVEGDKGADVNGFSPVEYGGQYGWIKSEWIEDYIEGMDSNCVDIADIQTADPNDAQQYIDWKGIKQVNFCGQLCVCYSLGLKLSDFLNTWYTKQPSLYQRIFGAGRARGTGPGELVEMYQFMDINAKLYNDKQYSPARLQSLASHVIVSTRIDTATGRLNGGGVGHWVLVTDVIPERTGYGFVDVYNPFPNRLERYSWAEFIASARMPYGVIIDARIQNKI
jgi:hypothetical protein